MGNAHSGCTCCQGTNQHRLGLFYDDFRIVTYPPKRATPASQGSRDGSSRRSRRSQRDENEKEDSRPYERDFSEKKKRPSSTRASMNKNFAFGHKLLCPEDAQNKVKQQDNQLLSKNNIERDSPNKMSSSQENEELGDSDDRPSSEENINDVAVEKFKILESDPSERQNTPETKASKDRKTNSSDERTTEARAEEPADALRMNEQELAIHQ